MGKSSPFSPPPSAITLIVNVLLYSLLGIFAISVSRKDLQRLSAVPKFIIVGSLLRIIWFASEYAGWGTTTECRDPKALVSFCGRLAAIALFAAFSAILFFWWDIVRSDPDAMSTTAASHVTNTSGGTSTTIDGTSAKPPSFLGSRFYCQPKTLDILLKFWIFVVLGGLFVYKLFACDDDVRQEISDAEIEAIGFFYEVLAIGYLFVGNGLRRKLSLRESVSSSQLQFRVSVITFVCVTLFTLRGLLFLLYPLFGVRIKGTTRDVLYPWCFYTLPEILPSFIVLLFMMKRRRFSVALEDALLIAPTEHETFEDNSLMIFRV